MNTIISEKTEHGLIPIDIYTKLADNRVLFISGPIDDRTTSDIVATLLLKDTEQLEKGQDSTITIFLNSEGGDIRNIFAIYDMMKIIKSPIKMICTGSAMDEAAILLMAGMKGMRFATKNSVIAIGQLVNDKLSFSDMADAKIMFDQSLDDHKKMIGVIAKNTGKTVKETIKFFERKVYMTADQAVKYGIIDKVLGG